MDLNQIEKQLTDKSNLDIRKCAQVMVDVLKNFARDKAGRRNASGINWPTNRTYNRTDGSYTYETTHFDWRELENYLSKALRHEYSDYLVKKKTSDLLSKLELLD